LFNSYNVIGCWLRQCDANGDGELDVLDVVIEVDCILTDCWEPEPSLCDGLTEVELWGEYYDIATTTEIDLYDQGLTGSIPPEIGCLMNLTGLWLHTNQLTGEIPPEVCDLIESNNFVMSFILIGNNLINTCWD